MHEPLAQERELGSGWIGWWSVGEGGLQGTPTPIPRSSLHCRTGIPSGLRACRGVDAERQATAAAPPMVHPLRQLHPLQRRRIGTALIGLSLSPIPFNSWFADVRSKHQITQEPGDTVNWLSAQVAGRKPAPAPGPFEDQGPSKQRSLNVGSGARPDLESFFPSKAWRRSAAGYRRILLSPHWIGLLKTQLPDLGSLIPPPC